jgi:HAD superfamily hydrolase (TIGR01509 family)
VTYGLVIFDCDGVLVDSEPISNRVFVELLRDHGHTFSYEDSLQSVVGLSMPAAIAVVEERLGCTLPAGFAAECEARTLAALAASVEPTPGIAEVLDTLAARAIPVCVASSGTHAKIRTTLGRTGLLPRLEGRIFSGTEVRRGKPAPDLFLHAARTLGADPARCAVVEDAVPGVEGARAAGMRVFGYAAHSDPARLERAGARVFTRMEQLPELLREDVPGR